MDTNALKKFAQEARRELLEQVEARLEQVLHTDSVELREKLGVVNELRAQLQKKTKENLIEEVAYTWFNRFCALRYMDVNHITKVGVVSPMPNFTQPEILQEAKQGIFDKDWQLDRSRVRGLLDGSIPSSNPEHEAYRLLLVAVCNSYAEEMDFLFPRIEGYTELLMPEDLLSTQSVLLAVREALTKEVCQDVEVIGWLYQFYISEKKNQVMGQKGKVAKEDIPAVTQLFTPHWIVRYMVENSLGRLWLLNHPGSKIRNQMEYYIEPEQQESNPPLPQGEGGGEGEESFLKVDSPEELKILDPACGSGHILTYAFDLLYVIYEEMGYDPASIPQLILENNLYGIEIDKRAAMLSSFALMMKAVERDKRFFTRDVQPNILEMEDVSFDPKEVKAYMAKVGEDLWTQDLWLGLQQFENSKTFGSLIRPALKDVPELRERLKSKGVFEQLFLSNTNEKVQKVLNMSEYLSPRYHIVVANPPYFSKGMDANFKQFAKDNYPDSKRDTFSMFMERNPELTKKCGYIGLMTPFNWMFLSSFEKIRKKIIDKFTILSLIRPEFHAFFDSAFVSVCTFVIANNVISEYLGSYIDLTEFYGADIQAKRAKEAIKNHDCGWIFTSSTKNFRKIPGSPIAYWVSEEVIDLFENNSVGNLFYSKFGMSVGDSDRFIRYWYEVSESDIKFNAYNEDDFYNSGCKWAPLDKGGSFRKWYGNQLFVVNWENKGKEIRDFPKSAVRNPEFFFRPHFSWTLVSSGTFSARYFPKGYILDTASNCVYFKNDQPDYKQLAAFNSVIDQYLLKVLNPTMNNSCGVISKLPYLQGEIKEEPIFTLIDASKEDWDSFEVSKNFGITPLLKHNYQELRKSYAAITTEWQNLIENMKSMEEEINKHFIESNKLDNYFSWDIPFEEITLSWNPYYRYGPDYTKEELESRLLEDTMKDFISYAVGCMFGRYSLDKPGLILANLGDTIEDYRRIIDENPTFPPTETNVIPILEGEWFPDDILVQFKRFLRATFGEENFAENLRFIEDALGKDLQKYFLRDFYKDHVQMYKKHPIYWLFSSPNGSFNALIYMHRYTPETVSVVLNQYLREYRDKLTAHRTNLERISTNASARDKSQALKEIEDITKILAELKEYEDEILYPLASQQIEIDLDDGVVVNYAKFGKALKKI